MHVRLTADGGVIGIIDLNIGWKGTQLKLRTLQLHQVRVPRDVHLENGDGASLR